MNSNSKLSQPYKPVGDIEDVQIAQQVSFKQNHQICKFKKHQRVDFISTFYTGNVPSLSKTPNKGILVKI